MPPLTLSTADGVKLAADLVLPASPRAAVVVAGAMGVPPRYYGHFCDWLGEQGIASIRFAWRGMPGSPAPTATLHEWAEKDLPVVVAALRNAAPGVPLSWLGHSVGGQLFGLLRDPPVERALMVASQSGYWGNWPGPAKFAMWGLWHVVIPAAVATTGRLPMSTFGQGEDLPGGVAMEWARWGRHPDYVRGSGRVPPDAAFHRFKGPVTLWALTDDRYAPPPTVEALARMYPTGHVERIAPADVGVPEIGHFGPFRPTLRTALWGRMRDRLVD